MQALDLHVDRCDQCQALVAEALRASSDGADARPREETFGDSELVAGRYRVIRLIARGGMGEVFEVYDLWLKDTVALKTLIAPIADDPSALARLKAEVLLARRVSHSNVCRVFDLGFHDKRPVLPGTARERVAFLTMELLRGETLRARLRREGRLGLRDARPIAAQMITALAHAHDAGIIHRDLKSDNVMLVPAEGTSTPRVVVTDFGLARSSIALLGQPLTLQGERALGTLDYMAPEQLEGGPATRQSDIYALGVVLFEMVTGRLPFDGDSPMARALRRIQSEPPQPSAVIGDIEGNWQRAISKCLAKRPADRFDDVSELATLLEAPVAPRSLAAPLREDTGGRSPFVGREPELDWLHQAFRDARGAQGQLVLVGGEPGVGKSRLVARFADELGQSGVAVLWAHCWEAGAAPMFWPWVEIVQGYLDTIENASMQSDLPEEVRRVFANLQDGDPAHDVGVPGPLVRFRIFDLVARFLRRAAARTPLVLVLEDLHAADDPSLSFLSLFAPRVERSRLLVVGTYRPREGDKRPGLADLLNRANRHVRHLLLTGMTQAELGDLVRTASGGSASPDQLTRFHALTSGNPFFALELLHDRTTRERLLCGSLGTTGPESPGLHHALERRFSELPAETVATLRIAAVIGKEFSWTVAHAVSTDAAANIALLEPALQKGLILPAERAGVFRFAHSLIRDALYSAVPLGQRLELHGRVAEELELLVGQSPGLLFQVANHYRLAAPQRGAEKAVIYGARAAARACELMAYEVAGSHYRAVLDLMESQASAAGVQAADIFILLARAQEYLGQRTAALESFERAADLARFSGANDTFARAILGRFGIQHETALTDHFVRRGLSHALERAQQQSGLEARLLAASAVACTMSTSAEERRSLLERALSITRQRDDPETFAWVLSCVHRALLETTTPRLLALASEMVHAAERADVPELVMDGHLWRATYLMRLGRAQACEVELFEHERLARSHCDPYHQWQARVARAGLLALVGDLEAAEIVIKEAHASGTCLDPFLADATLGVHLFMIALQRVGSDRIRLFREGHAIAKRMLATIPWFQSWAPLALRETVEVGESTATADEVRELVEETLQAPLGAMHRLSSLAALVPLACALEDAELARRIYESMRPFAGSSIVVNYGTYFGQANHYLAALAKALDLEDAARDHARAAALETARIRPNRPPMRSPATLGAPGEVARA